MYRSMLWRDYTWSTLARHNCQLMQWVHSQWWGATLCAII